MVHTMAHKERVIELATAYFKLLVAKDPARWGYLSESRVQYFAAFHDNPKLDEENARRLFMFYGKNRSKLPSREREGLELIIAKIEKEEKSALSMTFSNLQEYRDLEHIIYVADEVDRGKDVVAREEMGKTMRLASDRPKLINLNEDVLVLERNYVAITQGHRFEEVRTKHLPDEVWRSAERMRDASHQVTSCVLRKVQSLTH